MCQTGRWVSTLYVWFCWILTILLWQVLLLPPVTTERCGNCTQGYRASMWKAESLNLVWSQCSDRPFPAWQIQKFRLSLMCVFFNEDFPTSPVLPAFSIHICYGTHYYLCIGPFIISFNKCILRTYSVRHRAWYRLSATCKPGPGLLREQWERETVNT